VAASISLGSRRGRGFVTYSIHQEAPAFLIPQSNNSECVPIRTGLSSKSDIV